MERTGLTPLERLFIGLPSHFFADGIDRDGDYSLIPFKYLPSIRLHDGPLRFPIPLLLSPQKVWPLVIGLMTEDGGLEPALRVVFREQPGVFVDVGVNFGQSLIKCKSVDPGCPYVGFEPNVNCCKLVEDLIVINDIANAHVLPVALWNDEGVRPFFSRFRLGDPTASIMEDYRPSGFFSNSQKIYSATGDSVIESLKCGRVSMIKIDVEGGEPEVLEGLVKTIQRDRPYIYFEVLANTEWPIQSSGLSLTSEQIAFREARYLQLEEFFRDINYEFVEATNDGQLVPRSRIQPDRKIGLSNYLAGPSGSSILAGGSLRI